MSCDLTSSQCYTTGEVIELEFVVTDQDGVAVDISSGYTIAFAIARRPGTAVVIGTEISPASATVVITDGAAGTFEVEVDGDDTADLLGDYWYEAIVTHTGTGKPWSVGKGIITFTKGVVAA